MSNNRMLYATVSTSVHLNRSFAVENFPLSLFNQQVMQYTSLSMDSFQVRLHSYAFRTIFFFGNNNCITMVTGSAFGTRENRRFTFTGKVNLRAGTNKIALLSVAVGLPVSLISPTFNIMYCRSHI